MASEDSEKFDLIEEISKIVDCPDETSMIQLLRRLVTPLGASSFIFATIMRNECMEIRETHRFLLGCIPELCQTYNGRKWYLNDPCLLYARRNIQVIPICEVPITTNEQRRLIHETVPFRGFRSGIIVPVHSGTSERIAVLYLGSDADPVLGNPAFMKNKALFKSIAMELLEWWIIRIRHDAINKFQFDDVDLNILRFKRMGFSAASTSKEIGLSAKTIYGRLTRIKEILEVENIGNAIAIAQSYGLID